MPLTKVSSGVIAANAVVDSFGTQSITGDKLGLTAINANNIVGGAVTGDKLGATSINANNIVNATITGAKLVANTVSGDVIGQNAISSNNIVSVNASVATVGTLPTARLPSGTVLQVVSTTKTDTTSFASSSTNAYVDITGMSVTITPTTTTSRMFVMYTAGVSQSTSATIHIRLLRDSTSIGQGNVVGNRLGDSLIWRIQANQYNYDIAPLSSSFLDTTRPASTSAITYKLQATLGSSYDGTFYLNRPLIDDDQNYSGRTASTITVMEIAA